MSQLVFVQNGQTVTDSLTVATTFGKEHKRVIQDIRELECSEEFRQHHFVLSSYKSSQNKELPKYSMTKDGFTFLAMGYTGSEAARFKELYIAEFNRMAEALNGPKVPTVAISEQPPFPEYDQITKLLQMLRIGIREQLFTASTEQALRNQIARTVFPQLQISRDSAGQVGSQTLRALSREVFTLPNGVSPTERWYLTSEIANLANVSIQMVAAMSSRHNMRTPDKSRMAKTNPGKLSGLVQVMYNEDAKNELLQLLKAHTARGRVRK